jgi:hypothetical protein
MCYNGFMSKERQAEYARKHYEANKEKMKSRAAEATARRREAIRRYLIETKNVPCSDCGKSYPYYVMDFDHIGEKLFDIGNAARKGKTLQKVVDEVAKCEVVCSNCHRIRTHNRRAV